MNLFIPTKVFSEDNCVEKHGKELASFGKMAMVVTGKHSARKTGALDDVVKVLESYGVTYILFEEIEENPSVETVMKARNIGVQENVDYIIGIGGGSPLDAAKAIAVMIANPKEPEAVLYEKRQLEALPVVCIPTTCGTGSEVTPYAILTLHKERTKKSISHRIFPVLALLDAKYLRTLSRNGLVNTCVDALAHMVESYLNTNSNELNRIYSREGLRLWAQFKERLLEDKIVGADYTTMLHASMAGGMAISHTGTSLPHGMSYSVTYELGVPHGKAVGMFLGGYVEQYENEADVKVVLELLGFESATAFRDYMRSLLGEVEVSDELLKEDALELLKNPTKLKNYPFKVTEQELVAMAN